MRVNHKRKWLPVLALPLVSAALLSGVGFANDCTWKTLHLRRVCGIITDWEGKPISGFQIEVSREKTDLVWRTVSDADGHYMFSDIPAGKYQLRFGWRGYTESQPIKLSRPTKNDVCVWALRIELRPGAGDCPGAKVYLEKKK